MDHVDRHDLDALDGLAARLRSVLPADAVHASARWVRTRTESLAVRQGVVEAPSIELDEGVMVTVWADGGLGYGATSDLSDDGLADAVTAARRWARMTAGIGVVSDPPIGHPVGRYSPSVERPLAEVGLAERVDLLTHHEARLAVDDRIVDRHAALVHRDVTQLLVTNGGGDVRQRWSQLIPSMEAVANDGADTQSRSLGGFSFAGQGGLEVLVRFGFADAAPRLAEEALELLSAPNCPSGRMGLVLDADAMVLQIHESIGHPLELDRILGDERNYAGTSFVTPDMFGTYRYGSELLNVTVDPTVSGELTSYGFDDDGTPATREHLIRDGVLERPLGGALSQSRAGMAGVANSRAENWNRPPIDRMVNLNVEPGTSSFDELIGGVERGVFLQTNNSWSIDDSRNKFQFGCERGTLITDGELTTVVRNPGYRGISAEFWRNLSAVGDPSTHRVMGVPNCGKGEPNQLVLVGHASPPCRFDDTMIFGGDR